MGFRSVLTAGVLAAGLIGLSACGASVDRTAQIEVELAQLAEQGDISGRLFMSLKEHRPELYNEFLKVANDEMGKLQSASRAGYRAGERMRPKLVVELAGAISRTSDQNVADMIKVANRTYRKLGEADPQECFRNVKGLPPKNMDLFTEDMINQELELMIKVFEEGPASGARAATEAEINAWMMPIVRTQPKLIQGLGLMNKSRVSDAEAKQVCDSMMGLMNNLQRKPVDRRALLFRGLLKMAEQQSAS